MKAERVDRHILCLNAGSSSLKFNVYSLGAAERALVAGAVSDLGQEDGRLRVTGADGGLLAAKPLGRTDHDTAVEVALSALAGIGLPPIDAIGHRVVHGGPGRVSPERITPELTADLRAHAAWAPLHLPPALGVMDAVGRRQPGLPQVACFDTAFHAGMPEVARRFPLPARFFDQGIRRFGFHGLSYEYVLSVLPDQGRGRLVMAHLGNGASMAACLDGLPVETTMGMTPMGGFMMGTRSGDMDPGVLLHLLREMGYDYGGLERLLDKESGLKGVSGLTGDMETLLEMRPEHPGAALAVEMYCYQARKAIGALAAVLGGLDHLVFTGGIGENAAPVREEICVPLAHLGIELDGVANSVHAPVISREQGGCTVRVVPTKEELMIARHTCAVVFGPTAETEDAREQGKEDRRD